ncbi:porin [Aquabacterium sp.]|jgi:predicted porin|uniref:porin n=1 Tax=Aquabacterium sp. TaxID=1872578 RepID=UPI0025B81DA9|nr:porin [Aquabacterium sp.]
MQKTALTKAVALALLAVGTGSAFAQSSLTLYGNIDAALDSVHKSQGNINGSLFQVLPQVVAANGGSPTATSTATGAALAKGYNSAYADKSTVTRLTSSISSVNAIGVKGVEDLGEGLKASFVLEGQFQIDNGAQSGQDSRMWGRQAYVGLTTPAGEVRLGRQYAPMFYAFAFATVEALGGADLQGAGLVVNNLQVRQDNQLSYWLKLGGLTGALSYSPNAGVDAHISSNRGQVAGAATGQIVGGQTAGNEATGTGNRGQSFGAFANYQVSPDLMFNASYHGNKFGNADLLVGATGTLLYKLDKYSAYSLGGKFTVPDAGTQLSAIYHTGKFTMDSGTDIKVNTLALGAKHPIDKFAVGAQYAVSKFANFTKGKDTSLMLIGDYNFSKRTKLYVRAGYVKDDRGDLVNTETAGLQLAGGPLPLLTGLGALETPFFSAGGANIDATTRVVAIGIRHTF